MRDGVLPEGGGDEAGDVLLALASGVRLLVGVRRLIAVLLPVPDDEEDPQPIPVAGHPAAQHTPGVQAALALRKVGVSSGFRASPALFKGQDQLLLLPPAPIFDAGMSQILRPSHHSAYVPQVSCPPSPSSLPHEPSA